MSLDAKNGEERPQGAEESEDDGAFEMLDLLCDQVEVEDYKEGKKRELEQMKKIMDDRQ